MPLKHVIKGIIDILVERLQNFKKLQNFQDFKIFKTIFRKYRKIFVAQKISGIEINIFALLGTNLRPPGHPPGIPSRPSYFFFHEFCPERYLTWWHPLTISHTGALIPRVCINNEFSLPFGRVPTGPNLYNDTLPKEWG